MKWITREHVKVDRVACPWLIRKFVDKDAEFVFVPRDKVMAEAKRLDAIPYDVPNVELGHHGKECSFEAIVKKYQLDGNPGAGAARPDRQRRRHRQHALSPGRRAGPERRSPKAFAISATRTITRSMPPSGSSTTRSMPTAEEMVRRGKPHGAYAS